MLFRRKMKLRKTERPPMKQTIIGIKMIGAMKKAKAGETVMNAINRRPMKAVMIGETQNGDRNEIQ